MRSCCELLESRLASSGSLAAQQGSKSHRCTRDGVHGFSKGSRKDSKVVVVGVRGLSYKELVVAAFE